MSESNVDLVPLKSRRARCPGRRGMRSRKSIAKLWFVVRPESYRRVGRLQKTRAPEPQTTKTARMSSGLAQVVGDEREVMSGRKGRMRTWLSCYWNSVVVLIARQPGKMVSNCHKQSGKGPLLH